MNTAEQLIHDKQVATWLLFCAAVVFGMILLGGVTRLTHSGLSMVEWKPLMGVIPPLTEQEWRDRGGETLASPQCLGGSKADS